MKTSPLSPATERPSRTAAALEERLRRLERLGHRAVLSGLALGREETVRVLNGHGVLLFVDEGKVWLTQEHDTRDIVVTAGDWFCLDRDGLALIEGLPEATITMTAPGDRVPPQVRLDGDLESSATAREVRHDRSR